MNEKNKPFNGVSVGDTVRIKPDPRVPDKSNVYAGRLATVLECPEPGLVYLRIDGVRIAWSSGHVAVQNFDQASFDGPDVIPARHVEVDSYGDRHEFEPLKSGSKVDMGTQLRLKRLCRALDVPIDNDLIEDPEAHFAIFGQLCRVAEKWKEERAILQAAPQTTADHISEDGALLAACMVRHIDPNGSPREVLDRIINWEVAVNTTSLTPVVNDAPKFYDYAYEWDCSPGVVHRSFSSATWNGRRPDRTVALFTVQKGDGND